MPKEYVLQMKSGAVDAAVEGALLLVSIMLCVWTLDHIRGLCLEHKLRQGKVVALDGHSLTVFETSFSILIILGLPIAALVTSLGRNGDSNPVYSTRTGTLDVWDRDMSGPTFPYSSAAASVLSCGTHAANLSPQIFRVGSADADVHCPGDFKNSSTGFVQPGPIEEQPPVSLFPAEDRLQSDGEWRSQCISNSTGGCYAWKWTKDSFAVCNAFPRTDIPKFCRTYRLAKGAPEIDTDKAGPKVSRGSDDGGRIEILAAHFTVTTLKEVEAEVVTGQAQVTKISAWSSGGVIAVLFSSIMASLLAWGVSFWARVRWGYNLRLHTYSGIAAYAASLEDKYNTAEATRGLSDTLFSLDTVQEQEPVAVQALKGTKKQRPHIRLRKGNERFAGQVCFGQDPRVNGVEVKSGKIETGIASFDGTTWTDDSSGDSNSLRFTA